MVLHGIQNVRQLAADPAFLYDQKRFFVCQPQLRDQHFKELPRGAKFKLVWCNYFCIYLIWLNEFPFFLVVVYVL